MTEPHTPVQTFPRMGHGFRWSDLVSEMVAEAQAAAAAEAQPANGTRWLPRAIEEAAS